MFSQIKQNRIFILLPRSCAGVGLRGAGGVKNFSVGICDGAPSTARSSSLLRLSKIYSQTDCILIIGYIELGCQCPSMDHFKLLNFFLASGNFCCLLITFANSLDPDQDQQNVCPDLDPKCLTL